MDFTHCCVVINQGHHIKVKRSIQALKDVFKHALVHH